MVPLEEIAVEIAPRLDVSTSSLVLRQLSESSYLLVLGSLTLVDLLVARWPVIRAGSFSIICKKKKWSRLMGSEGSTLPCLVNLELRGLPVHVWECSSVENC